MLSITQLLRRTAQTSASVLATQHAGRSRTWRELEARVATLAAGLRGLGLRPGDKVAVLAHNSDHYYELMFAVPWAGCVIVPINTRLAAPEVVYWLNDSDARVLIAGASFAALVASVRAQLKTVETVVSLDACDDASFRPFSDLLEHGAIDDAGRRDDDLLGLFYTGGTTGRSKGVMLSHRNVVSNSLQLLPVLRNRPGERTLHATPMFHIADFVVSMPAAAIGGSNYFVPAFDVVAVCELIQRFRIERTLLVPTMLGMLLQHPEFGRYDLSSLKTVLYGASPMPEALIRLAIEKLPNARFHQLYGQTESSPALTCLTAQCHDPDRADFSKVKANGQALPGVDIAILDASDRPLPRGEVGEICARGANVMLGYHKLPEQTAKALANGWLHTGDGGYMDEDGYVHLVDRLKDMIISGGENVYSVEVESALYRHPAIAQCAVIGLPHAKWGEQVHAIVFCKTDATQPSEKDLIQHCKSLIADFKCPRSVAFEAQPLPISGAGKILKSDLRKRYAP